MIVLVVLAVVVAVVLFFVVRARSNAGARGTVELEGDAGAAGQLAEVISSGAATGSPTGSPTGAASGSPTGSPTGSRTGSPTGSAAGSPTGEEPPRGPARLTAAEIVKGVHGARVYSGTSRRARKVVLVSLRRLADGERVERLGALEYASGARLVESPDALGAFSFARLASVAAFFAGFRAVWHAGEIVVVATLRVVRNGNVLVVEDGAVREARECAEDGASLWAVARGAWGGLCCVSRSGLEYDGGARVAFELPKKESYDVVQPFHEVSATFGTRWSVEGCTSATSKGGVACDGSCAVCDSWEELSFPFSCVDLAAHGWCSAHGAVLDRCALSCGLYFGELESKPSGASAYIRALNRDHDARESIFAKTPPRVAMYMPEESAVGATRVPVMRDLTATVRCGRWRNGGVLTDPSVSNNEDVNAWQESDRQYFWRVLRAMDAGRLGDDEKDFLGTCVHKISRATFRHKSPVETEQDRRVESLMAGAEKTRADLKKLGGEAFPWFAALNNADTARNYAESRKMRSYEMTETPYRWRDGESVMDMDTCASACVETTSARNLNYFGILGICVRLKPDAWDKIKNETLNGKIVRSENAAHKLASAIGSGGAEVERILRDSRDAKLDAPALRRAIDGASGLDAKQKKKLYAFLARDYDELSWREVGAMFALKDPELAVLKRAVVAPAHAHDTPRTEWRELAPKQRLALVSAWNARVVVSFVVPTSASVTMKDAHSKTAASAASTASSAQKVRQVRMPCLSDVDKAKADKFVKFYTMWPTDRLTRVGATMRDGNPRGCFRCGLAASKLAPPVHAEASCDGDASDKGDSLYYEDDGTRYKLENVSIRSGYTTARHCASSDRARWHWSFPWKILEDYKRPVNEVALVDGTVLYNDCVFSVELPPGFACYVTPHLHSFHMSERSCMHGLAHLRGTPDVDASNPLQCMMSDWRPQFETFPTGSTGFPPEPRGFVLINDDLARSWVVRAGDVLYGRDQTTGRDRFPFVVNCLAAWNYYAEPRMWLQRAHDDPNAGDLAPIHEAVSETNNVRQPSDSIQAFIAYHEGDKVNVRTVLRTSAARDVSAKTQPPRP